MRVILYGVNYFPELTGIGKYSGEMARWLSACGHDVRVVTAPPYYPEWRVSEGYSAWRYKKQSVGGILVWRCPIWIPRKPTGMKRLAHLASFALSSAVVMIHQIFWRPDVVLVIEPPLFCAPIALAVARVSRAKSWLHVQDFEVDTAFELGLLRSAFLKRMVSKVECWITQRFDVVSSISERMLIRLETKGVPPAKRFRFVNWVDTNRIAPMAGASMLKVELGIPMDSIVALYSGNMGEKQGLETLIEAARLLLNQSRIVFVMSGHGASYERLREQATGLTNIRWIPLQPLDRLGELLTMADIHLLPQRANVADLVMPSKLTGILASGRPVVAGAHSGTQVATVGQIAGMVVEPENARDFAKAILTLSRDPNLRQELGQSGRSYAVANWDTYAVLTAFEKKLSELLNDHARQEDKKPNKMISDEHTFTNKDRH